MSFSSGTIVIQNVSALVRAVSRWSKRQWLDVPNFAAYSIVLSDENIHIEHADSMHLAVHFSSN